jgi:putative redox protein
LSGIKATARRLEGFTHEVTVNGHKVTVDEPEAAGGANRGPSPTRLLAASLAACTAITIEMYADRKGWDVGSLEIDVEPEYGGRGEPSIFNLLIRLPAQFSDEQVDRITDIAAKCPVHRVLIGDVEIQDRVERV